MRPALHHVVEFLHAGATRRHSSTVPLPPFIAAQKEILVFALDAAHGAPAGPWSTALRPASLSKTMNAALAIVSQPGDQVRIQRGPDVGRVVVGDALSQRLARGK